MKMSSNGERTIQRRLQTKRSATPRNIPKQTSEPKLSIEMHTLTKFGGEIEKRNVRVESKTRQGSAADMSVGEKSATPNAKCWREDPSQMFVKFAASLTSELSSIIAIEKDISAAGSATAVIACWDWSRIRRNCSFYSRGI